MSPDAIIDLFQQATYLTVVLVGVIILPGLLVGLFVAMFQAATQINETSLSFVPKLVVTLVTMAILSPWLLQMLSEFTTNLFHQIPTMIG